MTVFFILLNEQSNLNLIQYESKLIKLIKKKPYPVSFYDNIYCEGNISRFQDS